MYELKLVPFKTKDFLQPSETRTLQSKDLSGTAEARTQSKELSALRFGISAPYDSISEKHGGEDLFRRSGVIQFGLRSTRDAPLVAPPDDGRGRILRLSTFIEKSRTK